MTARELHRFTDLGYAITAYTPDREVRIGYVTDVAAFTRHVLGNVTYDELKRWVRDGMPGPCVSVRPNVIWIVSPDNN